MKHYIAVDGEGNAKALVTESDGIMIQGRKVFEVMELRRATADESVETEIEVRPKESNEGKVPNEKKKKKLAKKIVAGKNRPGKFSEEDKRKILARLAKGDKAADIAKDYDVTGGAIYYVRARAGEGNGDANKTGKRVITCSKCHEPGHIAKTCKKGNETPKEREMFSEMTDEELDVKIAELRQVGMNSMAIAKELHQPWVRVNKRWFKAEKQKPIPENEESETGEDGEVGAA